MYNFGDVYKFTAHLGIIMPPSSVIVHFQIFDFEITNGPDSRSCTVLDSCGNVAVSDIFTFSRV